LSLLERVLCRTRTYRLARRAYQQVLNRSYVRKRSAAESLFRPFVRPGSLVFDVGAAQGEMTDLFLGLRANVIAVEANPTLAEMVRRRYPKAIVEEAAAGPRLGTTTMWIGHDPKHSTVSPTWMNQHASDRWAQSIEVPIVTLDSLIQRHGLPTFVKIDVEGYEDEVLRGLSHDVDGVAFEFQCTDLAVARGCLERLSGYEFNYSLAERRVLESAQWLSAAEVFKAIRRYEHVEWAQYGDVYARRVV
jgi:FkbM family methyltransferase